LPRAQRPAQLDPVHVRQIHVQQQHVHRARRHHPQRLRAEVGHADHGETRHPRGELAVRLREHRIVLNDQGIDYRGHRPEGAGADSGEPLGTATAGDGASISV
jgi:hypothetical protein